MVRSVITFPSEIVAPCGKELATLQISEVHIIRIGFPLKRDATVGVNGTVEQPSDKPIEPFEGIKEIEEDEERLHHLGRMNTFMVDHATTDAGKIQLTDK